MCMYTYMHASSCSHVIIHSASVTKEFEAELQVVVQPRTQKSSTGQTFWCRQSKICGQGIVQEHMEHGIIAENMVLNLALTSLTAEAVTS